MRIWNRLPSNLELEVSEYTKDIPELERCEFHHLFVYDDVQRGRRNHSLLKDAQWVATGFTESQFHCWKRLADLPEIEIKTEKGDDYVGRLEEVKYGDRSVGHYHAIPKKKNGNLVPHDPPPFRVSESIVIPLPKRDQADISEWSVADKWNNRFNHWAKIKGEIWKVQATHIVELDKHMMNGVLFKRQRVVVEVPLKTIQNGAVDRIISEQEAFMYVGIPSVWEDLIDAGYLYQPMTIFTNSNLSRKYYSYTNLEANE